MSVQIFSKMLGLTMRSVTGRNGGDEMLFTAEDGSWFLFNHIQDCCERVRIEDVVGDLSDLVGSPIVLAEQVSSLAIGVPPNPSRADDSYTWTFYRFGTAKGMVTVRWLGTSNGYYSESVYYTDGPGAPKDVPPAAVRREAKPLVVEGLKITLYYYTVSGGDGSAYPRFFTTKEKRDRYMKAEENSKYFEGFTEADGDIEVIVNSDGTLSDSRNRLDPEH